MDYPCLIKWLREKLLLTQTEFSDLIDVDSSDLPNFERYVNSEQIGLILQEIRELLGIGDVFE